jgi:tetratricopeptide (TPR) repeat protein
LRPISNSRKTTIPMSINRVRVLSLSLLLPAIVAASPSPPGLDDAILDLTHHWARVSYKMPPEAQSEGFHDLVAAADRVAAAYPGRAEPLVWEAIVLASDAKASGGINALREVRRARDLLLEAERIDPHVLSGSIYTSLGTLYANVPGWPLGFGDADQARKYFEMALQVNPTGIDQNFFFGEFLAKRGEYAKAYAYARQALEAPPRPGREDSDAGRRAEAQRLLNQLRQKHGDQLAGS